MQTDRTSGAYGRAHLRARALARLRAERGDTLIEVVIAALMVALIATASLGGFGDIGHLTEDQRNEGEAASLAQQDQARLRGLSIPQLSTNGAGTGNQQTTTVVDGTTYTITSTSKFISGANGGTACSGSGTNGAADEIQTTSAVTWGTSNGGRAPVIVHGLITPSEGGGLIATVDGPSGLLSNPTGAGLAGVTVSLSGPTAVSPVTTDSNGCAVFAGLASGTYVVTYTPPASGTWVTQTGSTTIPTASATVTTTQTASVPTLYLSQTGAIGASFTTTYNTGSGSQTVANASDTFELADTAMTPSPQLFGTDSNPTNSAYVPTLTTPSSFFAYPSGLSNDLYSAWAGGCTADEPTNPAPTGFSITPGTTTSVTIPEPALIIQPYTETASTSTTTTEYDDTNYSIFSYSSGYGGAWTHNSVTGDYNNTESDNSTANKYVTVNLPTGTTSATWIATEAAGNGIANVSVNGGSATQVNLGTSTTQQQVAVFTATTANGLTGGSGQTLTITVTGQNGISGYTYSHGQWVANGGPQISIDAVNVTTTTVTYGSPTPLTTQPDVTLTDNGSGCGANKDYPPTVADPATNPGGALQYPGVPATTYTICVDDGTNHATLTNVAVPATGQSINTPTIERLDIYSGGTHGTYGTGVCT
jgi:type II secretory pathway pseudopilin PulG